MEWRFRHPVDFTTDPELCIEVLRLERVLFDVMPVIEANEWAVSYDVMKLTIGGHYWDCVLIVRDNDLTIRLQDLETPHLRPGRK